MHDPHTTAFEIYLGRRIRKNGNYRSPIITIWHKDPCNDGTDDSCGWFMRARHGSPEMLQKIRSSIKQDFDTVYEAPDRHYMRGYFTPTTGAPVMSVHGIVINMFSKAAWEFFNHNRKKQANWMNKNLYQILYFAENPCDSLRDDIIGTFRIGTGEKWNKEEAIKSYSNIIYGWLLRSQRKWWQHPRWHIHHWHIQFNFLKRLS